MEDMLSPFLLRVVRNTLVWRLALKAAVLSAHTAAPEVTAALPPTTVELL